MKLMNCLSNIFFWNHEVWPSYQNLQFTIIKKTNSNAQNVEKSIITRKGKICQCFWCQIIQDA